MRILFAGTADIAVPTIRALAGEFEVGAVLTNPDKKGSRGNALLPCAVKEEALELGLPVLQPESLRTEARELVASYGCDTLVCFAYGKIFGPRFLSLFSGEKLNIHPSMLPLLRGPSPIQGAILSQYGTTGISIQRLAPEMDSGDLLVCEEFLLQGDETTQVLTDLVKEKAAILAVQAMRSLEQGSALFVPQEGEATYTSLITREMALIDWNLPAKALHALIRAMQPWPKAYTAFGGETLYITSVVGPLKDAGTDPVPPGIGVGTVVSKQKGKGIAIACLDGLLWIDRLQLEKRKEMDWVSFLPGNRTFLGTKLG
ncbi:MAG: methionyl-tRNA formyltransferase [Spirochaetia bacterium]|nr:methionyl-tRNA formyltransferase [Spirochaetia bacterium]